MSAKRRRTLTRSVIATEPVSVRTFARVASWRVLTNANAEIIILEFHTLVYVAAGSIVGIQSVSGVASTSITAPDIQAHVLTESRYSLALVDILKKS